MQENLASLDSKDIDLREIMIILWAHKIVIVTVILVAVALSAYYARNKVKQYTSVATFKLDINDDLLNVNKDMEALSNIAGLGVTAKETDLTVHLVKGRIFIKKLNAKLNFLDDPFFNRYDPNKVDAYWKTIIKRLIGWSESPFQKNPNEEIWQGISKVYSENVNLSETDGNATKIAVTHYNPDRAAEIANSIMEMVIINLQDKKNSSQDDQLSYLSETLSNALIELEVAQSKLKTFSLENSAIPFEGFAARSMKLEALRVQWNNTDNLYNAVNELLKVMQKKYVSDVDYRLLRQKFPIVDQVEFRRILGQNEIISSWTWPSKKLVEAVLDTLIERKVRLKLKIDRSQTDAERYGQALKVYAMLEREAQIAEATYTVLIEQVKTQSMFSGYRPDTSEVYEYAAAPISPSAPSLILILTLGSILGFLLGCGIAVLLALKNGICYSKTSLRKFAKVNLTFSTKSIRHFKKLKLNQIFDLVSKSSYPVLRDLGIEIHKSKLNKVIFSSSSAKLKSINIASCLASYMQTEDLSFAVIDFSSTKNRPNANHNVALDGPFMIEGVEGQVSTLVPKNDLDPMEFISHRQFSEDIDNISKKFDFVFMCADNKDAISLLRSMGNNKLFHITLARTKHTRASMLSEIQSIMPIQGLLHE